MGGKIIQRITSMSLAGAMLFSVLFGLISGAGTVYAATVTTGTGSNAYNRILNPDVPEDYDETSTVNPYTNDKTKFMLSEESELMVNLSWDIDATSKAETYIGVADTYTAGGKMYLVTGDNSNKEGSWNSVEWTQKNTENTDSFGPNLNFQQGIAFDPTGSGRKDHVAFVGWSNEEESGKKYNYLWIYDTVKKKYCCKQRLGEFGIDGTNVVYVNAPALYSITAGDYNDDGRDTVVVYNPSHGNGFKVLEYAYSATEKTLTKLGESQKILHTAYQNYKVYEKQDYANLLGCNLTTGDFDGDGVDDLGLISYGQNYNKNGKKFADPALYEPMIAAVFGEDKGDETTNSTWSVVSSGVAVTKYVWNNETTNSDHKTYESMRSPSISAGDVDGDGMDELVCAGYYSKIEEPTNKEEGEKDVSYSKALEKKKALAVLAEVTKGTEESAGGINCGCTEIDTNKWSQGIGNNAITEQLATACVATKGRDAEEEVFISGTFYNCKTGTFMANYTGNFFNREETGNSLAVTSVAVGNFTGDADGREQVMCAASDKEENTGNDDIYMKCVSMGYGKTKGATTEGYYQGEQGADSVNNKGDHLKQYLNACVVAVDNDYDGVIAEYKGKNYVYSDPKVAAVLQAGPYFGEVDDAGAYDDPCETSYSITTTYEKGATSGDSVSFGAGFAQTAEATLGAAFEEELRVGYAMDWTKTFEKSTAVSYTTAFTAQMEDQVIISRIPIVVYSYNIYTEHKTTDSTKDYINEPIEEGYAVSIPGNPVYYQLSINEYNQFVGEYNTYVEDGYKDNSLSGTPVTLKEINKDTADSVTKEYDLPRDSEGNPQNYFSTWAEASGDGVNGTSLSQNAIALSYSGGNSTSEWATSESTTEATETSHGFDFELSVLAGGGFLGNSVKLGGYVSLNYMKSSGKFETYAKEKGASGTVQNINKAAMLEEGYDEDLVNSYGFNWEFGVWKRKLTSEDDEYTPFYGYRVWDVRRPLSAPTNLEVEHSTTDVYHSAELTWDLVEDKKGALLGYHVYVLGDEGYTKLTETRLGKDVNSYTVTGLNTNTEYTFAVTAEGYRINTAGNPDPSRVINSVRSNEASIKTPRRGYKITLTGDKDSEIQAFGAEKEIKTGDDIFEGDAVTISVGAKEGYTIQKVLLRKTEAEGNITESDITSTNGQFSFAVKSDTEIVVTSKKNVDESEILYQAGEHGSIISATTAGHNFKSGALVSSSVTLQAKAEDGYVLKEWKVKTGNATQSFAANGCDIYTFGPYAAKHEVTAIFVKKEDASVLRTITLNHSGIGGKIIVTDSDGKELSSSSDVVTVNVGTQVIITAKADPYYVLGAWSDDFVAVSEENTSIQQTVYEDIKIGALFYAPVKYKVQYSVNDEAYGTITSTVKTNTIHPEGTEATFTAMPEKGYRLEYWKVAKGKTEEITYTKELQDKYECTLILDDTTKVTAHFKKIETFKLDVESEYGTVKVINQDNMEVTGGTDIFYGDVLTVTAVPEQYHELHALSINQNSAENGCVHTVYGNVSIKAEYQRLLTTDGKEGEMISDVTVILACERMRYTGEEVKPDMTVKVGTTILSSGKDYQVTYRNNKEAGTAEVIVEGVGFYKGTLKTTFTILKRYALKISSSAYGTIQVVDQDKNSLKDGDYIYQGDCLTVTAEPKQYYKLTALKANGIAIDNETVITVDKDMDLTAEYQRPLMENGETAQDVTIAFSVADTKYCGKEIKANVSITVEGKKLKEGVDYEVLYANNVNPGTATATIKGKGIYQISLTKTFQIAENKEHYQAEMAVDKQYTFTNKKISLKWGKVKRATGYDVFLTNCGKNFSKKPTITTKKTSASIKKLEKKKLNTKESYKAIVKAYRMVNGKKRYISTTEIMHIAGANSKYTNAKKITGTPKTKTLKVGKTYTIKAKIVKENKNKPLFKKSHVANLRYRSSDSGVAQVSANGKVKAKGKGTCVIYVIAGNGLTKEMKVTVR